MAGLKHTLLALLLSINPAWADTPPAAPAMLLAEVYSTQIDVTQYWISEKYDGVRAQWDGHTLRFRGGGVVPAPAWFTAALPPVPLDGELWLGRNRFDALSALVRTHTPKDADWQQVRYLVFELPGAPGDFSTRLQRLTALVTHAKVPWLQAVEHQRGTTHAALMKQLDAILRVGGEGLMLHRADAPYLTGRSDALLKLKPWHDAEAIVVGHLPGKGKYAQQTGALLMEMPDGQRFRLGSGLPDALRRAPPPPGTQITYRYQQRTPAGLPRFPRYLRVRTD